MVPGDRGISGVGTGPTSSKPTSRERSRVSQVAKVPVAEQAAFHSYAERFGLNMSAVAILLLARELRLRRLTHLCGRYPPEKGALLDGKIIAYLHGRDLKEAFRLHAANAHMRPGPAAAAVFRAELTEQWLERVIGMC